MLTDLACLKVYAVWQITLKQLFFFPHFVHIYTQAKGRCRNDAILQETKGAEQQSKSTFLDRWVHSSVITGSAVNIQAIMIAICEHKHSGAHYISLRADRYPQIRYFHKSVKSSKPASLYSFSNAHPKEIHVLAANSQRFCLFPPLHLNEASISTSL